ncbi:TolC family protein [Stutzerimonas xanthomarina]|uniref:Outer membrane protein TolC n=2 Tax=Stutzerimonas xanthomarina TaxID=271420 RepID=A0A1M5MDY7_9GAMM|nr:TolC family protein [Stutzerimonas xanthomarina]MCP9338945.1 TolC family protein [Stutzerimonas xanthomarina]SEH90555.1 Outer membrane protein TolC [Stutzerimonas xanthomarina]SHG75447.1 Outer membrane protein TolC [Stutzerimonas xanthomarina DSM 18231]
MKPLIRWAPRHVAALTIGVFFFPGLVSALTLEEALSLAEHQAPSLAAQVANLQAARSAAIPAGELPDPKLKLGLQSVPIEGDARWQLDEEAMTMQMVGVMQEVPNRAKRQARIEAARASVALADVQQTMERLSVRQATAEAWIASFAVEQKLSLFKQLYTENKLFSQAVHARIAGGRGQTAEGVLPKQEAALLAEQEDELLSNQAVARADLRRWIGGSASQPLTGTWPRWPAEADHHQNAIDQHPALLAFDPMVREAEAKIRQAIAEKTPDWSWGVDYLRRGREYGDMVNLSVSFDLPIFTGSRQDPKIAAERARLAQVEAQRQATLRMHDRELTADLAEYRRLTRAVDRLEESLLPLAEQKVQLAMADYRAGKGELIAVIDARRQLVETRLRRIDTSRDLALSNARLHFAFGDTQP